MKWIKNIIKQEILEFLLLLFILGVGFIWLGDSYGIIHVSDDGKLSGTVLWLTSLGIFWYAYETYQLKMTTADQAGIQEEIMRNEFLPILEPLSAKSQAVISRTGRLSYFQIQNLGKGPAKYIEVRIGAMIIDLELTIASQEKQAVVFLADIRHELAEVLQDKPKTLHMRLTYKDIYKRKFQTENIIFDRAARGGVYHLRQGTWDFKRVRTP